MAREAFKQMKEEVECEQSPEEHKETPEERIMREIDESTERQRAIVARAGVVSA
eukprot:CAMPEP_0170464390 /NCGR_PEP_ID=MMETSP0123-20130129/9140_1 /TAXON_ID=182087 /ORGANISM="Favella ehrenbergii, Strain Fehren 1" /LENGTH=53 /DNA_ID=CAMNT_0010730051 /DNA_START=30 /DNA_END=191 /DNA_ORIENTATION=-